MHRHTFSGRSGAALVALSIAAALTATAAQAQWTWRDRDGRITASDMPPPRNIPDKDILSRPLPRVELRPPVPAGSAAARGLGTVTGPSTSAPAPADRELEARKRAAEAEKAAKSRAEAARQAAARADNCTRARGQLAALDSGQRLFRLNGKGEQEVLDDKARAEESRRAREVMASDCR
jgi:Domain of unknown function (DUF4124)